MDEPILEKIEREDETKLFRFSRVLGQGDLTKDRFPEPIGEMTVKATGVTLLTIILDDLEANMTCTDLSTKRPSVLTSGYRMEDCLYKTVGSAKELSFHLVGLKGMAGINQKRGKLWQNPLFPGGNKLENKVRKIYDVMANKEGERCVFKRRKDLLDMFEQFNQLAGQWFASPEERTRVEAPGWLCEPLEDVARFQQGLWQFDKDIEMRHLDPETVRIGDIDESINKVFCNWNEKRVERPGNTSTKWGAERNFFGTAGAKDAKTGKMPDILNGYMEIMDEYGVVIDEGDPIPTNPRFRLVEKEKITGDKAVEDFLKENKVDIDDIGDLLHKKIDGWSGVGELRAIFASLRPNDEQMLRRPEGMSRLEILESIIAADESKSTLTVPIEVIGDLQLYPDAIGVGALSPRETTDLYEEQRKDKPPLFACNKIKSSFHLKNNLKIKPKHLRADYIRINFIHQELSEDEDIEKFHNKIVPITNEIGRAELAAQALLNTGNVKFLMKHSEDELIRFAVEENLCIQNISTKDIIKKFCNQQHRPGENCTTRVTFEADENITYFDLKKLFVDNNLTPNGVLPIVEIKKRKGKVMYEVYVPQVPVNEKNIKTVMASFNLQSAWEQLNSDGGPYMYTNQDVDMFAYRVSAIERVMRFTVPAWFAVMSAFAEMHAIGVGCGEQRTYIPRAYSLSLCTICKEYFESTTHLLLHLTYQENALNVLTKNKDHATDCGPRNRCFCQVAKIGEDKGAFYFETERGVTLGTVPYTDLMTMKLKDAKRYLILLTQLKIPCYLPGSYHGRECGFEDAKTGIIFGRVPTRQNSWSEVTVPTIVFIDTRGTIRVKEDLWIQRFSSTRVDAYGFPIWMTTQHLIADAFERSLYKSHTFEKAMAKCAVLLRTFEKSFKIVPMRSALFTDFCKYDGLIFLEEEVIMFNVYRYCIIDINTRAGAVRRLDICRLMMQTSQKLATTDEGKVFYNLLKKLMFDMTGSAQNNPSDIIMTPDRLFAEYKFTEKALEAKTVDFGKDPETGISFVEGVEVLRKLEKVNAPGKPYLKTYNELQKLIEKFRKNWPTMPNKESEKPKRKSKPKCSIKNRKQCENFELRNEKEYLEKKAEESREDLQKKKQKNLEVMLQEMMRSYLCETCERIVQSGKRGGRPQQCSRGCYRGLSAESDRKRLYNKWKKEFTRKLETAEEEATYEVNESSEDEIHSDEVSDQMFEGEVIEKTKILQESFKEVRDHIDGVIDEAKTLQKSVEVLIKHYEASNENVRVNEVEVDSRLTTTDDLDNYRPLETLETLKIKPSLESITEEISDDDDSGFAI